MRIDSLDVVTTKLPSAQQEMILIADKAAHDSLTRLKASGTESHSKFQKAFADAAHARALARLHFLRESHAILNRNPMVDQMRLWSTPIAKAILDHTVATMERCSILLDEYPGQTCEFRNRLHARIGELGRAGDYAIKGRFAAALSILGCPIDNFPGVQVTAAGRYHLPIDLVTKEVSKAFFTEAIDSKLRLRRWNAEHADFKVMAKQDGEFWQANYGEIAELHSVGCTVDPSKKQILRHALKRIPKVEKSGDDVRLVVHTQPQDAEEQEIPPCPTTDILVVETRDFPSLLLAMRNAYRLLKFSTTPAMGSVFSDVDREVLPKEITVKYPNVEVHMDFAITN